MESKSQRDIDQEESANPDNWGRFRYLLPIYFSKRDSRLFVPLGFLGNRTINLGHRWAFVPAALFCWFAIAVVFGAGFVTGFLCERADRPSQSAAQESR